MREDANTWPVNIDELLSPISPDCPSGEFLRYEDTYDRIREARREDDPHLPQGVWQTKLKQADWTTVDTVCTEALMTSSKDLQIAVWLCEAWMHLHGMSGLQAGLALLEELCRKFWDTLHPLLEEDNLEPRLSPIRWMNEKLSLTFKQIPLTLPHVSDVPACTWLDREHALHLETLAKQDANVLSAAEASGKVTIALFQQSIRLTPTSFFEAFAEDVRDAIDRVCAFEDLLHEKCGNSAASLSQFKGVLLAIQHLVNGILTERNPKCHNAITTEHNAWVHVPHMAESEVGGAGKIRSRDEAYQLLGEIADYLMNVEPHSPTSYLIKRAVTWGGMSLVDLLQELVQNPGDLQAIYSLLGLKQKEGG